MRRESKPGHSFRLKELLSQQKQTEAGNKNKEAMLDCCFWNVAVDPVLSELFPLRQGHAGLEPIPTVNRQELGRHGLLIIIIIII